MEGMSLYYSGAFAAPLPAPARFPAGKSLRLRERLLAGGVFDRHEIIAASAAADREILRVHSPEYLARVRGGTLGARELRAIGFPWSEALVERSCGSIGATLAAAREALARGWSANLSGGTHHAFAERGAGYCVFNDVAIASRALQAEAGVSRILVIDCDVHQGNGTAAIFHGDDSVFTFSMHAARNYPFHKEASDLDVELADRTADDEYLWHLERGLDEALERARPQFAFYLAGADPHEDDRLGRLALTKRGLGRRDEHVLARLQAAGIPVAIAMAGGYARDLDDSVDIHANTLRIARDVWET